MQWAVLFGGDAYLVAWLRMLILLYADSCDQPEPEGVEKPMVNLPVRS